MKQKNIPKIYIGVAWPYVNDLFHIGNMVGSSLPADIFARFCRLLGNDVLMVSGSDFHGTPITLRAEREGVAPKKLAEKYHTLTKEYFKKFSIEFSFYTSTHTKNHTSVVQEFFLSLLKKGYIKKIRTKQLYSESLEKFLQDRYVEGECPHCHFKEARGDQCEACGRVLDSSELLSPISKINKQPLVLKDTENYFLDLKKLQPKVASYLRTRKGWRSWVKQEALGWVKEGLKPRAITRDLSYGVPLPVSRIPKEDRIVNIEHKVFYVWFEAVIGYLSAAIEYSKKKKNPSYWKSFFFNKNARTYYMVGQDNLVFHTINWPAQLLAYNSNINLPTNVYVNKFLLLEGKKVSKSREWYVDTAHLANRYHQDSVRFYLAYNMPESKEFNFTWQDFMITNNSVLVGSIGNLVHRALSFSKNHVGSIFSFRSFTPSKEMASYVATAYKDTHAHFEKGEFRASLHDIVRLCERGNKLFDHAEPWKTIKEDKKRTKEILMDFLYLSYNLRILLSPFLPSCEERLSKYLGVGRVLPKEGFNTWKPSMPTVVRLSPSLAPLFSKIEREVIEQEHVRPTP